MYVSLSDFQAIGTAKEKVRKPYVLILCRGTSWWRLAEGRCLLAFHWLNSKNFSFTRLLPFLLHLLVCYPCVNPSPGNGFFATFAGNRVEMPPPPPQGYLEFTSTWRQNSNRYVYVFGVKLSSNGSSDFIGRRCVLEIQDSSQITGSTK